MATTDTNVPQVIVNKLTSAEYAAATKSPTEFYAVTDAKVDTTDIADGAITTAKIASGAVTSDKASFTTYSTSEQVVGTWINGKPLYRKVIDLGSLPNNTLKYVQIAGGARVEVVDCRASVHTDPNSSFSTYAPTIPSYHPDTGRSVRMVFSEYQIGIASNYDASDFSANALVYYWKTTD